MARELTRNFDDPLYAKVKKILKDSPEPILVSALNKAKGIEGTLPYPCRTRDVCKQLKRSGEIQMGWDEDGRMYAASLDHVFPYKTTRPALKKNTRRPKEKTIAEQRREDRAAAKAQKDADKAAVVAAKLATKAAKYNASAPIITKMPETPAPKQEAAPLPYPSSFAVEENQTPVLHTSLDDMAKKFAVAIVQVLANQIATEMHKLIPEKLLEITDEYKGLNGKEKIRLPRVVVVGCYPQQAGLVAADFKDKLDIVFVTSDQFSDVKRLDNLVHSAEHTFCMTDFISHKTYGHIKNGNNVKHISGGLSSLRTNLRQVIAQHDLQVIHHKNGQEGAHAH